MPEPTKIPRKKPTLDPKKQVPAASMAGSAFPRKNKGKS